MLCMLLTRASCVLCVWRPSEQMSGPWLPPVLTQLMLTPATYLVCQWMQTERAQYVQVRPQTTIERTPLSPFTSRILVPISLCAHGRTVAVLGAGELPRLQGVLG